MIVAQEKRKTNIAEYILYMWQVEDIIRAYQLNIDLIENNIISQYNQSDKVKSQIKDWYANLIVMMHQEGVTEKGHVSILKDIIKQLEELHQKFIRNTADTKYLEQYHWAKPNIEDLKKKLPDQPVSDIETCFYGLYGLLLMRLKKKEVSDETKQAMQTFSNLLAILSKRFKEFEERNS